MDKVGVHKYVCFRQTDARVLQHEAAKSALNGRNPNKNTSCQPRNIALGVFKSANRVIQLKFINKSTKQLHMYSTKSKHIHKMTPKPWGQINVPLYVQNSVYMYKQTFNKQHLTLINVHDQ